MTSLEKSIAGCAVDVTFMAAAKLELKQAIVTSFIQSGCNADLLMNDVDDVLFNLIVTNVIEFYPRLTVSDFKKAFQLNAMGQLPERVESFGKFDPVFVGKVLSQYEVIRSRVSVKVQQLERNNMLALPEANKELTPEDWNELIERDRQHLKAGRDAWRLGSHIVFDYLYKAGILSDDNLTEHQWNWVKHEARKQVMFERKLAKSHIDKMSNLERDQFRTAIQQEAKRIIYEKYLRDDINNK